MFCGCLDFFVVWICGSDFEVFASKFCGICLVFRVLGFCLPRVSLLGFFLTGFVGPLFVDLGFVLRVSVEGFFIQVL